MESSNLTSLGDVVYENLNPVFYLFVPYWALILGALAISPLTILVPQWIRGKLSWPSKAECPDIWTIHGKRYNLRPFYSSHPGGSFALRAAKGSDCTGLFESYHVFIDRELLLKMLARFEVKDDAVAKVEMPPMVFHDEFYADLKDMVRDHFKGKGKHAHKMTTPRLVSSAAAWVTMWVMIYLILVHDALWCIPFISLLSIHLTGTVMHDASHNALVSSPFWNRILSHAAFPYGINVAGWHIQHVMSHHIYTNEADDLDLFHFEPVMTLKKGEGKLHIVLHILRLVFVLSIPIPHLCIGVPYGLLFGQIDPAHGRRMYDRVKAITTHRAELRWELLVELVCLFGFFFVCWYQHGVVKSVCVQMSIYTIASYLFCFFTQVSHLQEECFHDEKELQKMSFAKRQVASSLDFMPDSLVWGTISAGLNTQTVHHCFPSVSAMHLRVMYPKFRKVCQKHGIEIKESKSMSSYLRGFVQCSN